MDSTRGMDDDGRAPLGNPHLPTSFSVVSTLLVLWSLLIINEGTTRFFGLIKSDGGLETGIDNDVNGLSPDLASGFLLFASLFEICYGFIGLFLGLACILFGFRKSGPIKLCMLIQFILSVYVYAIFVVVRPVFSTIHDIRYNLNKFEEGLTWFLTILGIAISTIFSNALQGGQFMLLSRIVSIGEKSNFFLQSTGNRMRAVFWSACMTISGICTLMTGVVVWNKLGGGRTTTPYYFSPNVGRLPVLTTVTGICMTVFGLVGFVVAAVKIKELQVYYKAGAIVFLLAWLNFTIAQLSLVESSGGEVARVTGLVFAIFFLNTYFLWCSSKERSGRLPK